MLKAAHKLVGKSQLEKLSGRVTRSAQTVSERGYSQVSRCDFQVALAASLKVKGEKPSQYLSMVLSHHSYA